MRKPFFLLSTLIFCLVSVFSQQKSSFNADWQFIKDIDTTVTANLFKKDDQYKWSNISLPHTANIEPIEKVDQQWQGICFYRKYFMVPAANKGKHIAIQFDAAMQEADVYLNGRHIFKHL